MCCTHGSSGLGLPKYSLSYTHRRLSVLCYVSSSVLAQQRHELAAAERCLHARLAGVSRASQFLKKSLRR